MASITITFTKVGEGAENIVIELDEEKNKGKARFVYGDKAYFRVYSEGNYKINSTDGSVVKVGSISSTEEEFVQFVDSKQVKVSKPINSLLSTNWFGKSLGNITKTDTFTLECSEDVDPSSGKIGIAKVKYASRYDLYYITLPKKPQPEYPVLVVVFAEEQ